MVVLLNLFVVACAPKDEGNDRDTMTQRQKDSVLGQSGIPGSQGVTKALRASDSAKAHQARVDSATPP
jgi:hypothetical protein